ncbi:MAG: DUF2231 domain-containing protein [Adhaeribacter sp.]
MKILGHPIHLIMVHFPAALFPMDLVCSVLYFYTADTSFGDAAFFALAGGVLTGWLAVFFGTLDLAQIAADRPLVIKKAYLHGGINSVVIFFYTIIGFMQLDQYPHLPAATLLNLLLKLGLVGLLMIGNYWGASLLLKDKVGIEHS